ncbi:hypothetical protein HY256_07080, partial [Candidatus Sumerlaeota bacterium]|nr:hypothetical protein [Candidatus Sumerlaeota bacterium]
MNAVIRNAERSNDARLSQPLPGTLNVFLALVTMGLALGLMWFASHTSSWISRVMAAMIFSYVNNTIFSLLHECVHGNFHANRTV